MKLSPILLYAAAFSISSAAKLLDDEVYTNPFFMSPNMGYLGSRFAESESKLKPIEACVILQSMGWLVASLVEPVKDIPNIFYGRINVDSHLQAGIFVNIIRSMMLWGNMMKNMAARFQMAHKWPDESHMIVAQCYLQYAYHSAEFFKALEKLAPEFDENDDARCLMAQKINQTRKDYNELAYRLYDKSIQWDPRFITGFLQNFHMLSSEVPDPVPSWFRIPYPLPESKRTIGDYLAEYDEVMPLDSGLMWRAQQAWRCPEREQMSLVGRPPPVCNPRRMTKGGCHKHNYDWEY